MITLINGLIVTVILYFDTHFLSAFDLSKLIAVYVFTGLIMATWGFQSKRIKLNINNLFIVSILIMIFCSGVSVINSLNPWISLKGAFLRYDGYLLTCCCVIAFFTITNYFNTKDIRNTVNIILLCGMIATVYAGCQYIDLDPYHWQRIFETDGAPRSFSSFGNPAFYSAFVAMCIPLVYLKLITGNKLLYVPVLLVFVSGLYFGRSKACFIAFVISSGLFVFFMRERIFSKHKFLFWILVGVVSCVTIGFNVNNKGSLLARFKEMPTLRIGQYMTGLDIIKDYPLFGVGQDNVRTVYCNYFAKRNDVSEPCIALIDSKENEVVTYFDHPHTHQRQSRIHQDLLDVACNRGLIGIASYFFMLYAFFRMVYRRCVGGDVLTVSLTCSVVAYLVQNQFSFGTIPIILLWWCLMGMSFIVVKEKRG